MSNDNPQTFRARAQRMARHIEDRHGEPMTVYRGITAPNRQAQMDTTSARAIRAMFYAVPVLAHMGGNHADHAQSGTTVSTHQSTVKLSLATLNGLPWRLKRGDFVKRDLENETYEITGTQPHGTAFMLLSLKMQARPSKLSGLTTGRADITVATSKGL